MDFSEFAFVIDTIASGRKLAPKYLDHALGGNWKGFQDCHITPDWVLLYLLEDDVLVLTLTRTGSHSELDI
jgi:mRNA interferase YafQ